MSAIYNFTHLLAKLVSLLGQRLPKPAMFAVIGAIGCLLGALLGEILAQAPDRHVEGASDTSTELCLLIDCSGSMGEGKLQEVVSAATSFAHRQDLSRNPIGVVAFSTTAQPLVGLTSSASDVDRALAQLQAGGWTAMDSGLAVAGSLLQHPMLNRKSPSSQAILLFTDGEPQGPSQPMNSSLDVRESTRITAQSLRHAGMHIIAVGTGDANMAYLAELTGDPALVFFANQGGFDSAFRKAENAVYRRQLIDSTGKSYSAGMTLLRSVGWCVLVSLGLAFLLWGGQNAYLRRAPYSRRGCITLSQGGALAGVAAGLVAQTGLWLVPQGNASSLLQRATFILAWGVLGGLMGRGMSAVIPNLRWQTALRAGGVGGLVAGATFLITATVLGDVAGRLVGAAILGAAIGYSIALVEELARAASLIVRWGPKETTAITLGATPVTIGGGDDHVWLKGLPTKAYRVWMENGKVFCKDQQTGRQAELKDKSTFTVARVEFQVALRQK
jgi:Ca-activated chloride channel family protein